jgi:hypothetical protein
MRFLLDGARVLRRVAAAGALVLGFLPGLSLAALSEEAKLQASLEADAHSGNSVAISGTTAVVGAPGENGGVGAAYVFTRSGTTWTFQTALTPSDNAADAGFGTAVSISTGAGSGNIAVGAPGRNGGSGAVYVYTGSGASWTENANILTSPTGGNLGSAVSIKGFVIAAGAPTAVVSNRADVGIVAVFTSTNSGTSFSRTTFRPNGGQARNGALFGTSVSLSGSTIAAGAPGYHTGNKQNSGNMFIFVNNGGVWSQQAGLRPSNTAQYKTGTSVAVSGDIAVTGAIGANAGKGAVYLYTRTGTSWSLSQTLTAAAGAVNDQFGASVALQGSVVAVGAPNANNAGAASGKAYEFSIAGAPVDTFVATDNAAGDHFGASVSIDGGRAIIGAPFATAGGGGAADGAAYVFVFQQPSVTSITGFSDTPSLTGVPYDVFVHVDHDVGGSGTPTGTVAIDDGNGGTCMATLDGSGDGSCSLTSTFFGTVSISAIYSGDVAFSSSSDSANHDVTGNHLVFNPAPPPDVLQGEQVNGVVVEVQDGGNNVITSDNTTMVTISVNDTCGNDNVIATATVVNGVATFTGVGPKFYTATSGLGDLAISATSDNGTSAVNDNFDVTANVDIVFADGFEDCRL